MKKPRCHTCEAKPTPPCRCAHCEWWRDQLRKLERKLAEKASAAQSLATETELREAAARVREAREAR